jgi:peptide deformylase
MPVRPILCFPHPVLTMCCRAVEDVAAPDVQQTLIDLVDTMHASPGCVGIAAPQIGVALRIALVDVTPKHPGHGHLLLINPTLVAAEGERLGREGCLSLPAYTANVRRAEHVVVEALDAAGTRRVYDASGFEATAVQHEMDHLDGILFVHRVASLTHDLFRRGARPPRRRGKSS